MKKQGKFSSIIIAVMILMSQVSVVFTQTADFSKNWASKEIGRWLSYGVIRTYQDGSFKPSAPITRIDMAIMLNKLFNYQERADIKFSDVAANASYKPDVEKAAAAGIFSGNNGKFRPDETITRQEAAVVFARAFSLVNTEKNNLGKFKDTDKIASWSRDAVNTMVSGRYMNGVPGGLFTPGASITRAEAVKILDNMVKGLKNKAGSYTGDVSGSLIVNTKDIKLENMVVKGDLYLSEGIGNGEVTLNNVRVTGRTVIKGGGEHSIILNNTSISGGLIVMKKDGKVRVVASGNSIIGSVTLNSGAKLEESKLTGRGFENVEITQLAPGQQATLEGDFSSLNIEADSVMANIPDGKVGTVKIKEGTNGSKLVIGSAASVSNLIADDDVAVTGGSKIKTAKINSNGTVLDTKPESISIAPNITAKVAGASSTASTKEAPITPATPPASTVPPAAIPPATIPPTGGNGGGTGGAITPAITLSAANITMFSGGTTSSSVTVIPSDATLTYSSSKPSVVSVNTATGALTGVSTGSAVITTTASKAGYNSATAAFNVTVLDDPLMVILNTAIDKKNNITLTFNRNVLKAGQMSVYIPDGANKFIVLGTTIDFAPSAGMVQWENSKTVCIPCTAGGIGLDDTDAKTICIKITGVKSTMVNTDPMPDVSIMTKANDTKAPRTGAFYIADAGSTPAEDTVSFSFSEAMDIDSAKNLDNYAVSTPGSILTTKQALSLYDDISFQEITSDGKQVTLKVKGISASNGKEEFTIRNLKDAAGNTIIPGAAKKYNHPGFKPGNAKAIASNKVEITYNQDIAYAEPGAFKISADGTPGLVSALVTAAAIDGRRVTLTLDRSIGTATDKAFLYQVDPTLVRNADGEASVTFGAFRLVDRIAPVATFSATKAGIVIKFSEDITVPTGMTTEAAFRNDVIAESLPSGKIITPTLTEINSHTFIYGGLEANTEYDIRIIDRFIKDPGGNVVDYSRVTVKTPTGTDTKASAVKACFIYEAETTDEDELIFVFSEAMDPATAANLNNYTVSTPGSILTTRQALALYNDVSYQSISTDGKQVVFKVKGISASDGNEVFTVHDLKDLAGNIMAVGTVAVQRIQATPLSFLPSDAKAISTNQLEITYNREIGSVVPNAFGISADGMMNSVYAYTEFYIKDGSKLTMRLNKSIGTTTEKAYLLQLDNSYIKDKWGAASSTFSAFRLVDRIQPMVTFSATNAGIVITFSEDVTTTASGLAAEITLTKGGNKVDTFSAASISAIDAHTYKVGGLDASAEYQIRMEPKITVDLYGNGFQATVPTAVTTNSK